MSWLCNSLAGMSLAICHRHIRNKSTSLWGTLANSCKGPHNNNTFKKMINYINYMVL